MRLLKATALRSATERSRIVLRLTELSRESTRWGLVWLHWRLNRRLLLLPRYKLTRLRLVASERRLLLVLLEASVAIPSTCSALSLTELCSTAFIRNVIQNLEPLEVAAQSFNTLVLGVLGFHFYIAPRSIANKTTCFRPRIVIAINNPRRLHLGTIVKSDIPLGTESNHSILILTKPEAYFIELLDHVLRYPDYYCPLRAILCVGFEY